MKILKTGLLLFLILGIASVSFSQQKQAPDRKLIIDRAGVNSGWMHDIPDLTDRQREEIKQIRLNTLSEILPLNNELKERRARLQALTTGETDIEAAEQIADEIGNLQTEIMKKRLNSRQQIRELLTDDQRVIFDSRNKWKNIPLHMRTGGRKHIMLHSTQQRRPRSIVLDR